MKQLTTGRLAGIARSQVAVDRPVTIEKITKLSRFSSTMELLESRTMMSVGTLTPAPPLLSSVPQLESTPQAISTHVVRPHAPVKVPGKHVVAATTISPAKPVKPVKTVTVLPPASPTGLVAAGQSRTQIKLTWNAGASSVTGYYILRATDGVHFTQLSKATSNTYTDSGLLPGQAYQYEVEAFNSTGTSAASTIAAGATLLAAPTKLSIAVGSSSQLNLSWIDNDSAATGYIVLRSTNGVNFTRLTQLSGATTGSFSDKSLASFTQYFYEIEASTSTATSPASNIASATTALAVPTGIAAAAKSPTSVAITWVDTDPAAQGYWVYRSSDGKTFSKVGLTSSGKTTTWTDTGVAADQNYNYEVMAVNGSSTSAASTTAVVTTPMAAPTNLIANSSSGSTATSVVLSWTDNDTTATGYNILRSTDGKTFSVLTNLTSAKATGYTDSTVAAGKTYYYQVQATAGSASTGSASTGSIGSAVSNTASVAIAAPAPAPATSGVTITTRYGNELVITASGADDAVSVTQSGSTLTIVADGQTTTQPVPAAGLFIYTRGGKDGITVDQSVTVATTVETVDGAVDDITSAGTHVSVWDDANDVFIGTGTVQTVNSFAGGVSKSTGASLKDPGDSGTIMHASASLWGTGPVAGDINQGNSGDCYFLSSLAAFATVNPAMLQQSAVDMGDGTYVVRYETAGNQAEYVRVSNDLPTRGSGSYVYARPGASGSIWAAIMEKAYAFFRTGANTYASIGSGWMGDVYSALGVNNTFFDLNGMTESQLYNRLSADLAKGNAVTLGTYGGAPNLVGGHAYTLISVSISKSGATSYVVRNPWGISGDSLENSSGYATLTFAQMQANFQDCCEAAS